jgi:phosphoribosyl 1,2-cyclic phosphodiesterase
VCSSSAGNCVTLSSESSRLVIDCGLSSMKRTRHTLTALHSDVPIDAVLLTHIHSDHISGYPLRVIEEMGLPICLHDDTIPSLKDKHCCGRGVDKLRLLPHRSGSFDIGEFRIRPFEVVHNPWYPTFGYDIRWQDKKIVIATDFCRWDDLLGHFVDADFIFVESNHDLALLKKYYNPNSRYHLPNPGTAELLIAALGQSKKPPQTIMLGHLSSQRNTPQLALHETAQAFERADLPLTIRLLAAPLREAGVSVHI